MSNYHILNSSIEDHEVQVVFHIPIPNGNNNVGVNYQQALKEFKPFAESKVPWLQQNNPTEFSQLQNGEIYEYAETIEYDAKTTDPAKQAAIDAKFNELKNKIQDHLQKQLKYWGKDRDVP